MDASSPDSPPVFEDIESAARQIAGEAVRTPLLWSPGLSERCRRPVYLKPECLQRTGSFKFRGAFNRLSRLDSTSASGGVVAASSGNHAQGVAAAAAIAGLDATILMPADAPEIKRANTRALGARIVDYRRGIDDRDAMARALAEAEGRVLVPPYDDALIIAGQGTVGLEIVEDAARAGIDLEAVVVPAGGGGLSAGISLAVTTKSPSTKVYVAEPEGFDDHARSLAAGRRLANGRETGSICDALLAPTPGVLTFAINRGTLAGGLVADDAEVARAVVTAFRDLKLVVEPGGAVGLAALLEGRLPPGAGAVVVVLSGGNVDAALYGRLIGAAGAGAAQVNSAS